MIFPFSKIESRTPNVTLKKQVPQDTRSANKVNKSEMKAKFQRFKMKTTL